MEKTVAPFRVIMPFRVSINDNLLADTSAFLYNLL